MATGESNFEYLEPVLCDLVGAFTGDRDEDKNYNGKGSWSKRGKQQCRRHAHEATDQK